MEYAHEKGEAREYGRSPGNGITPMPMSRDPLATEGEATPGPDDEVPWRDQDGYDAPGDDTINESPTTRDDPFVFDDVGREVGDVSLPGLEPGGRGPSLPF